MWSETQQKILSRLSLEPLCWVQVQATQGSVPREAGAWMAVFRDEVLGTIGGGHLEWKAIAHARQLLKQWPQELSEPSTQIQRYALGPSLGQCCGGSLELRYTHFDARDTLHVQTLIPPPAQHIALFGAGHVGHALIHILCSLPYKIIWIDSREAAFPSVMPREVQYEHSDPVESAVVQLPAQTQVLIMSFSHTEDLEIVNQCLLRQRIQGDLPFVGLIGSKTKWASFCNRLRRRGFSSEELSHITCPIGIPGISGKEPEVIAVAVAAQLLLHRPLLKMPQFDAQHMLLEQCNQA